MGKASHLILLTNFFPYGAGEEYLEAELPHLSAEFHKITVIPTMAQSGDPVTREVPPNCVLKVPSGPRARWEKALTVGSSLARRNVSPLLVHLRSSGRPRRPSAWLYEIYFEARCQAIARRVLQMGIDVQGTAIWYSYWFYVAARVASLLRERTRPGVPFVSRGHGYDVNEGASPLGYLPQRELLLREVDRLWLVSQTKATEYRTRFPQFAHKIGTARLGSPAHPAGPIAVQDSRLIVSVSAIRPLKRLELIIDAVGLLRRQGLDVRWVHFGSGSRDYARELEERAVDQIGAEYFTFQGHVPNEQLHHWYVENPASVFVNVSTSEGVPVSIMEAMSYGLPVVATDVGGTAELLEGLPRSFILPADTDAETVASALRDILQLPGGEYKQMTSLIHHAWRMRWSADVNYAAFARDLRDMALAGSEKHG